MTQVNTGQVDGGQMSMSKIGWAPELALAGDSQNTLKERSIIATPLVEVEAPGLMPCDAAPTLVASPLEVAFLPASLWRTIEPAWRDLAGASAPNAFFAPHLALSAARLIDPAPGLGAFCVWRNEALVAFAPGRMAWGNLVFRGWTHPYAPFGRPLIRRGEEAPALDIIAAEARRMGARALLLPATESEDALTAVAGPNVVMVDAHARASFELGDLTTLGGAKAKEFRRLARRLAERGTLEERSTARGWNRDEAVAAFLALEAAGWKGEAGTALAAIPDHARFVEEVFAVGAATGEARVDALVLDGRAVAAALTLVAGDRAWYLKTTYDEALSAYSPGVLLTLALSRALAERPGPALIDSCAIAGHAMIERLWSSRLSIADLIIPTSPANTRAFAVLATAERLRRRARATAKTFYRMLRPARR